MSRKAAEVLCLAVVCNFLALVAAAPSRVYSSCETPKKVKGVCLSLGDCNPIYTMLNSNDLSASSSEAQNYLRQSQCGIDVSETDLLKRVLVCCPTELGSEREVRDLVSNALPKPGVCGHVLSNKIYGGKNTTIDEFPWLALLKYRKPNNVISFDCTGSLINKQYVLTAAHCVKSENIPSKWQITHVRLGEHDLLTEPDCIVAVNKRKDCAPLHKDIEVASIIPHEDYIPNTRDQFNDIALIRLAEPVEFSNFIKPICLPTTPDLRNKVVKDTGMEIAGWGAVDELNTSNVKLKASVKVWDLNRCKDKFAQYGISVGNDQVCAGGEQNVDTCRGDSGGPLMATEKIGNYVIVYAAGVVSYGPKPCGVLDWPGVYTKVENFIPWIERNLEP